MPTRSYSAADRGLKKAAGHRRRKSAAEPRGRHPAQRSKGERECSVETNIDTWIDDCSAPDYPAWVRLLHGDITRARLRRINADQPRELLLQCIYAVFGPDCVVQVMSNRVKVVHETATEWFDLPTAL